MKRMAILAIAVLTSLTLCACGPSGDDQSSSDAEFADGSVEYGETEEEAAAEEEANPYVLSEYVREDDNNNGYSWMNTMQIGPWVKASDTEMINNAWKAVGGTGSAPAAEDFPSINGATETAVMAFGTLTVVDTTEGGFRIADGDVPVRIALTRVDDDAVDFDSCLVYADGDRSFQSLQTKTRDELIAIHPKITRDTWGPVPFAICCQNALSPAYPDGDPSKLNAVWSFTGNAADHFVLSPMWVEM